MHKRTFLHALDIAPGVSYMYAEHTYTIPGAYRVARECVIIIPHTTNVNSEFPDSLHGV
jgi:hypothetical protein